MRFPAKLFALLMSLVLASPCAAEPISVLWLNTIVGEPKLTTDHRRQIVNHLNGLDGGAKFRVKFIRQSSGKAAVDLATNDYDVVVIDGGNPSTRYNSADLEALKRIYSGGKRVVMLDGTLTIRSTSYSSETRFPGVNGSSGALTANQIVSIHSAGGGFLIGADHNGFQRDANQVVRALIPEAKFSGRTDPSTNGEFIGNDLLSKVTPIVPLDLFRHWASIPSQGEVSVGSFTDFMGQPVELYALVEAADKPGGGRKRPYISVTFDPGTKRYALDSNEPVSDNMPTRVGPSRAENKARLQSN